MKSEFIFIISAIVLSGCMALTADVKTFRDPNAKFIYTKIAVHPLESQEGDLEWKSLRSPIEQQLSKEAFYVVDDPKGADYVLFFGYGIDQGESKTVITNIPTYGVTGYSGGTTTGTVDSYGNYTANTFLTPTYGITGNTQISTNVEQYTRYLFVRILDMKTGETAWQADLISEGCSRDLNGVLQVLIPAAFDGFPGPPAGRYEQVRIPVENTTPCD